MIHLPADNSPLLLFVIAAISYPLGRVKIKGTSLRAGSLSTSEKGAQL